MRLPRGCFKQFSMRQYSTLILMVCVCFVIKKISVGSSQTSRSAALHHAPIYPTVTGVDPLSANTGEAAVDTQCLAPSDDIHDVGLESGTREREPAANTTGIAGWMWIDETFEERKRRLRRNDTPVIKDTENKIDFVYKFVDSSQGVHIDPSCVRCDRNLAILVCDFSRITIDRTHH